MKKTLFILACLISLYFVMDTLFQPPEVVSNEIASPQLKSKQFFQIAIIKPVSHPSLEQIQQGFCETLIRNGQADYQFTVYNAQGNKILMRSEIEDITSKKYDLIFAIGLQAAKMSKEVLSKKQQMTPLVFGAVSNPEEHLLVYSELLPNILITGVSEVTDFDQELEMLAYLKKNLKNVLLVYDPLQVGIEENRREIEKKLNQMKVHLIPIEVFKTNEIKQKVLPFIDQADALIILKDNTIVTGLDTLAKLCQNHHVILLASDLDSPDKGAALGFGVNEYSYGEQAAQQAKLILEESIHPSKIPITPVDQFKLKVNIKNLHDQGLKLDPKLLFLIKKGEAT